MLPHEDTLLACSSQYDQVCAGAGSGEWRAAVDDNQRLIDEVQESLQEGSLVSIRVRCSSKGLCYNNQLQLWQIP